MAIDESGRFLPGKHDLEKGRLASIADPELHPDDVVIVKQSFVVCRTWSSKSLKTGLSAKLALITTGLTK